MNTAEQVLARMWENDHMSQWLGLEVDHVGPGTCRLQFSVRKEMLNGFGSVHGGVLFAAADSAFAFACNSYGQLSVALDAHINFVRAAREGERLRVEATEEHNGRKTGVYRVKITSGEKLVASFTGTAFRTENEVLDMKK